MRRNSPSLYELLTSSFLGELPSYIVSKKEQLILSVTEASEPGTLRFYDNE
ncbi:TPA: hypothetical protein OUD11_001652 [Citrobacter werkmanii]|nr:hypothetical protein [Citrobacter werkmanii]